MPDPLDLVQAEKASAPRRHPVAGGYARGEETRKRIVTAALKVFGEDGYEGASTRRIAELAGVKPPALQYYFNSKEGLHRACAEHILMGAEALFDTMAAVNAQLEAEGGRMAIDGVCAILDVLIDLSPGGKTDPTQIAFLARAQADGGPALKIIEGRLTTPLRQLLAHLVGAARGEAAQDETVKLTALTLLAQVSAFQASRERSLAFLGWTDLGNGRRGSVSRALRRNTKAVLTANAD